MDVQQAVNSAFGQLCETFRKEASEREIELCDICLRYTVAKEIRHRTSYDVSNCLAFRS